MASYKTVKYESSDEFITKKSRFIGYVKPVKTVEEATAFISEIKSKHWDACCYQYRLHKEGYAR